MNSGDNRLSSIAEKSLKEVTYHLRWSSEWVIRLGEGTEESHRRMNNAMLRLWKFTGELYTPADFERDLAGQRMAPDGSSVRSAWQSRVKEVLVKAGLSIPSDEKMETGGKNGKHTEVLQRLLNEMQYMQRTYHGVEL
jgi:ring-1,2-phenylacetyl-CoA epoxidase subunit PaaC